MITIDEFKIYFARDLAFLPVWSSTTTYNKGERVYYESNRLFYECVANNTTSLPTVAADWSAVTDIVDDYINDQDIQRAIDQTAVMLPASRFEGDSLRIAQMWLTAHNLVLDLRIGNQGLASQFPFPLQSKSVGSVSSSYGIPSNLLTREAYSYYITSGFGLKYLALLIPRTRGNVGCAYGLTTP